MFFAKILQIPKMFCVKTLQSPVFLLAVGYYAERLCLTPQYLDRVVKSLSGRTVSGWINFTLVGEITRRLENTNETMRQIATALNFPDHATLTKFFKRETGYSLTEYKRKSRG